MIFYLKSMLILFAPFSFLASNTDDLKPKIELVSPLESTRIFPGGTLNVNAVLSDNMALEDYHISISKGGSDALCYVKCFSCNNLINASVDATGNPLPIIKGKLNANLNFNIGVAKDAVIGDYDFTIHVKDKAGNKHIKKVNFMISRF
ncbi:DUF4625 domain-containing protein [Ancylomarina sp.]|uniref:DUF4625 domain-containing protein n=1 Tax=Ancylomarina sp. TaxID=1970196 RepID=UPI00356767C5